MNPAAVPSAKESTAIWVAYALFGVGLFLWWPTILALIVCYSKRAAPQGGFVASHHRWLIRSFWWSQLWQGLGLLLLLAVLWPVLAPSVRAVVDCGDDGMLPTALHIDWATLLTGTALGLLASTVLLSSWCWLGYRTVRGMVRLAAAQPMPD